MLKVIQIGSNNFILDSDPRISELVDEAKQRDVENTREQIKQLRLDICETLPEGTTELPVLLSNLQIIWGKSSDTRRRYVADALVLDEQVRILGADDVEYGITIVSRLSKNDKFNVIKERL
jgi:hypothetical protein